MGPEAGDDRRCRVWVRTAGVEFKYRADLLSRYFLWDCVDAIMNFDDAGFLLHGAHGDHAHRRKSTDTAPGVACLILYAGIFVSVI